MKIVLFILEKNNEVGCFKKDYLYKLTIIGITDKDFFRRNFILGKRHKYYYHHYAKYFTIEDAREKRSAFKKKNAAYFSKRYMFDHRFWKRYLLWNKPNLDDSIYDLYIRFNIKVTKLF